MMNPHKSRCMRILRLINRKSTDKLKNNIRLMNRNWNNVMEVTLVLTGDIKSNNAIFYLGNNWFKSTTLPICNDFYYVFSKSWI